MKGMCLQKAMVIGLLFDSTMWDTIQSTSIEELVQLYSVYIDYRVYIYICKWCNGAVLCVHSCVGVFL